MYVIDGEFCSMNSSKCFLPSSSFSSNLFQSQSLLLGKIKAGVDSRSIHYFDYKMKYSRFRSTSSTSNYQGPRRTSLGKVAMPISISVLDRGTPGIV